jgi:hypothetical protein
MVGRSWHAEHVCSLNLTFISLFSSNFQHFNAFRPLFQKLLEINVKFKLQTCSACQDLPTMQFWSKSCNVAHFYNLNLTSISYNCWNICRKVLKCWKFEEKREIIPKWVTWFTSKWNCKHVQHVKICLPCNFEVNPVTHFGVISLFSSNFQHFNTFRHICTI